MYLGGVATALASYLQAIGQRGMTAERASILYAMDPVYGAVFAYLLLDEHFGVYAYVGVSWITIAAATNAHVDFGRHPKSEWWGHRMTESDKRTSNLWEGIVSQ